MLPRANRLGTKGFSLLKTSRNVSSEGLSLRFSIVSKDVPPRVAVVVSSKTAKTAVERNRLRRLVREAVQAHLAELPNGFAGAFFVKGVGRAYTKDQFSSEVTTLFRKSGHLKP